MTREPLLVFPDSEVQILRVKKKTASSKLAENSTLTDLKKRGQEIHGFVPPLSTTHIRQHGKKGDANIHTPVYICTLGLASFPGPVRKIGKGAW